MRYSAQKKTISVNEKYKLTPLLTVQQDDIRPIFEDGKGVYICNFPNQDWYDIHHFERRKNYSIEKKEKFFGLMQRGSYILSPTQDSTINKPTKSFNQGYVIHLGSSLTGRLAQVFLAFKMISWLVVNRKKYNYCLVYNFSPSEILAAFFAKKILRKEIIVDFEDDISLQTKNKFYNSYFKLVKNIPDVIICINKNMVNYFKGKKTFVFNGFIDLGYIDYIDFELKEKTIFLYAGALDSIRGVDLIPDLIRSLRKKLSIFSIVITGSGPFEKVIRDWDFKEISFLGFLDSYEYEKILFKADIYLVLQKPDHPFSLGSFPSKIEYYSKYKKPIYKIELEDVINVG